MRAVILGAGIAGRVYLDTLKDCPESETVEVVGFIDDNPKLQGCQVAGIPVLGTYTQLPELIKRHNIEGAFVVYSDRFARLRGECFNQCRELGLKPINIIHPSAMVASSVSIGEGVFIGQVCAEECHLRHRVGEELITGAVLLLERSTKSERLVAALESRPLHRRGGSQRTTPRSRS